MTEGKYVAADHHGTPSRYVHRKCRCDLCKKGWARYIREYTARKRAEALDSESRAS